MKISGMVALVALGGAFSLSAVVIPNDAFKPCGNGAYECDLDALGVKLGTYEYYSGGWTRTPSYPALYFGNRPMTLAREPNEGWLNFTREDAVDEGEDHPGAFRTAAKLPAGGYSLNGYWTEDWANETLRVESFTNGVMRLADRHAFGIGRKSWGAKNRRFYAVNHRDFLDAKGEWYLDRTAKKLYLIPPKGDINGAAVNFVTDDKPILRLHREHDKVISGKTFAFGLGDGIALRDCRNIVISNCTIECVSGIGVNIGADCSGIRIVNTVIRNVGRMGIVINGGDRRNLIGAGNVVEKCDISKFGLIQRVYAPGVSLNGCGNAILDTRIYDAPHSAIIYGGNEHLIRGNEIFNVIQETGDAGAIYTGRDWTSQGNRLIGNHIHDLGNTISGENDRDVFTMGIYLDDCDCGDTLLSNRFVRAGCAVMIGGGRDNVICDNEMVECKKAFHLDDRGVTWITHWNNPNDMSWNLIKKANDLRYRDEPWKSRYPHLAKIMDDEPRLPLYTVISNNVMVDCGRKYDFDISHAIQYRLDKFFSKKTDLFYNCVEARRAKSSEFSNGFLSFEEGKGFGAGMEDSAIYNGIALSMYSDKYDKEHAREVAQGLLNLATVHGVKGFVARGICEEDGKSVCTLNSRDQITHFTDGLLRYYYSGLCSEEMKKEIRRVFSELADRMIANVREENEWNALTADGKVDPRGILKMWNVRPHEAARLPMIYVAAWRVTGKQAYWNEYLKYADDALRQSAEVMKLSESERKHTMPGYSFLQMNASLEVIARCDKERQGRCWEIMKDVARLAADRFLQGKGANGPWLSAAGDLAFAIAMVSRIENLDTVLGAERSKACRELFEDCYYGVNGQPMLFTSYPARILSLQAAYYRLPADKR